MRPALGKPRTLLPGRDLPWKEFLKKLYKEFNDDAVDDVAATVTFYSVLAMFPFMLFLVAVLSRVVSWDTIDDIVAQVARFSPGEVTQIVSDRLRTLKSEPARGLLTLGFVGALWSASAGVSSLIPALNRAYDVVETRSFLRRRLLSLGATLGIGVVAVLASLIALAVPAVARWIGGPLGALLDWLRLPLAGAMMMAVWALLYTFLPNVRPRFQLVTPGSTAGVLLWVGASWGFTQYARRFGDFEATYGAIGGVIVLLVWMWVSAMALLLGAEINKILMPAREKRSIDTHVANNPGREARPDDPRADAAHATDATPARLPTPSRA